MKKVLTTTFHIFVGIFAVIGLTFTIVFFGMRFGLFNVRGSIASRNSFFSTPTTKTTVAPCLDKLSTCDWNQTPEWQAIQGGLTKDSAVIERVSAETGVSARMIAAVVVPEQTRFFTANREIFKSYFEPLKILGSMTQFSLGISGIKEPTAKDIELYANTKTVDSYAGDGMSALFAYPDGQDHNTVLYNRLTDAKDHYYQYLYTALFIKEIEAQWLKSGFDISKDSGTIVTLFNLGFNASHPNAQPKIGGATIVSGGKTYAYGELGALFYNSTELPDLKP
ncbi:MAG: hypothetical protein WCG55_01070 [bacterium]